MYIKDNITGVVRLYGTDCHDSLEISDDGKYLTYYNLQCGEGSKYGSYSFVTDDKGTLPSNDEDLIKHGAEAYFNIGGFNDTTDVLDNLRAEIEQYQADCNLTNSDEIDCKFCDSITFDTIYRIIDKYRNEVSE